MQRPRSQRLRLISPNHACELVWWKWELEIQVVELWSYGLINLSWEKVTGAAPPNGHNCLNFVAGLVLDLMGSRRFAIVFLLLLFRTLVLILLMSCSSSFLMGSSVLTPDVWLHLSLLILLMLLVL